jgi:pantothenate kinase type III
MIFTLSFMIGCVIGLLMKPKLQAYWRKKYGRDMTDQEYSNWLKEREMNEM